MTYLSRLAECAGRHRDAVAVTETSGRSLTWAELITQARAAAEGLHDRGMRPGDRVLFSVRPGIDALVLILAIHDNGGVIVAMDPTMGHELFAARCALLSPSWVVAESLVLAGSTGWLKWVLGLRGVRLAPLGAVPGVRRVHTARWIPGMPRAWSLTTVARAARGAREAREIPPEAEGFIVFTSGTTSEPKGVVHTRGSLDAILSSVQHLLQASEHDVFCSRELHLILPALFAGARVVIPRHTRFDAAELLADLERLGATHTFVVTSDGQAIAEHCAAVQRSLPHTLRMLLIGGAPVPAAFLQRLHDHVPAHTMVWCIYGMTELLPVARVSLSDRLAWRGEGDFVGKPVDGVSARVSSEGELIVRGPGLFSHYLGGPPVMEHRTGDLARIDANGITLLGRTRDMIIRGEHNIYPALYEPAFERVPGVRRCAMIGVPDASGTDERVVVVVEPMPGADPRGLVRAVYDGLRRGSIDIDGFARPDHVMALELPLGGRSSKVDRPALERIVRDRLT